jgi:hypothetical protein
LKKISLSLSILYPPPLPPLSLQVSSSKRKPSTHRIIALQVYPRKKKKNKKEERTRTMKKRDPLHIPQL